MIWQTDEACVELREEVLDRVYTLGLFTAKGRHADINDALDAYARAVAVACLTGVLHGYAGTATAEEVRARAERVLAELGGAE